MAGRPREPIALVEAKGRKHLTKDEIERRRAEEVHAPDDAIKAPTYLSRRQRNEFNQISSALVDLKIMKNLDVDALASYIVARDGWINAGKQLRKKETKAELLVLDLWTKIEDRYRKQMRAAATDLGLTITSRGKLVMPKSAEPVQRANKFAVFSGGGSS